jgi:hypothetical protein
MKLIVVLGLASLLTVGCAKNNLYFGTGTSVGIDVSGTPTAPLSASLAYKRTEVTFSRQDEDQEPYSVLGYLDMNVNFMEGTTVDQHFATGVASEVAAYKGVGKSDAEIKALLPSPSDPNSKFCKESETTPAMDRKFVFVTGSTIGIDLDFFSNADPHAVIGYKRAENAYIPVCKEKGTVGSVYSRMKFDSKSDDGSKFFTNTKIEQDFATGRTAEILASKSKLGGQTVEKIQEPKSATQTSETELTPEK